MSESTETYGDFVVACEPIARREVYRLRSRGVRMEVADGVHEALLRILADPRDLRGKPGLVVTIVRHRLIDVFARKRMPKDLAFDVGTDVDDDEFHISEVVEMRSCSPWDVVDGRLALASLMRRWPMPSGQRGIVGAQEARSHWAAKMRRRAA